MPTIRCKNSYHLALQIADYSRGTRGLHVRRRDTFRSIFTIINSFFACLFAQCDRNDARLVSRSWHWPNWLIPSHSRPPARNWQVALPLPLATGIFASAHVAFVRLAVTFVGNARESSPIQRRISITAAHTHTHTQ